jgi:hypothetical protein
VHIDPICTVIVPLANERAAVQSGGYLEFVSKSTDEQVVCGVYMFTCPRRAFCLRPQTSKSGSDKGASCQLSALTVLQITCPRRSPGPAAFTAKTSKIGFQITAATRALQA